MQHKRRESQQETRLRIVEATMRLHEEIGPRATTISAIAERAGVQRLTVYRHFPDETAVFQACTSHWLSLNPPPDPAGWGAIGDPLERTRAALASLYGYYSRTDRMWIAAYRDVSEVPALQAPMAQVADFLRGIGTDLAACLSPGRRSTRLDATVHHALAFSTWHSLEAQDLPDTEKTACVLGWIRSAADAAA